MKTTLVARRRAIAWQRFGPETYTKDRRTMELKTNVMASAILERTHGLFRGKAKGNWSSVRGV